MDRLCGYGLAVAVVLMAAVTAGQSLPAEGPDEAARPQTTQAWQPATATGAASQPGWNVAAGPAKPSWAQVGLTYIRVLPVQSGGRIMPVDTLARQVVRKVTGERAWNGLDAVGVLMAWAWYGPQQESVPMVLVENRNLRNELGLPAEERHFSYSQLSSNQSLQKIVQEAEHPRAERSTQWTPVQEAAMAVWGRLLLLKSVEDGELLHVVPSAKDARGTWMTIGQIDEQPDIPVETRDQIRANWERMRAAFAAGYKAEFIAAGKDNYRALEGLQAADWPELRGQVVEVLYNAVRPIRAGWVVCLMAVAAGLLAAVWPNRWVKRTAWGLLLAGFEVITAEILLRWKLGGTIPVATMYEWLVVMGWAVIAVGIVAMLLVRRRVMLAVVAGIAAAILLIADVGPLNPDISPLEQVPHSSLAGTGHR